MAPLLHFGQVVGAHAHATPERVGAADLGRSMTFRDWHARACRLANALLGLGLDRGDRVAVLAYNRIEWLEIYAAAAHAGLVAVPINFRLVGAEARYIVDDAGAKALIVEDALWPVVAEVLDELPFGPVAIVCIGEGAPTGAIAYEDLLAKGAETVPEAGPGPGDPWCLMYTSGTTGNPKGAIRSHGSQALMALTIEVELGFSRRDHGLLVMPMCHANSLNFMVSLTYCGAPVTVYDRRSFDPEHLLRALVVIGRKLDYQLGYGSPAVFPDARIMRIADTAGELVDNRRGDPEMLATPALALDAMVEAAGNRKPALEQKWAESLRAKQRERVAGRAATCPSGARTARCTRA